MCNLLQSKDESKCFLVEFMQKYLYFLWVTNAEIWFWSINFKLDESNDISTPIGLFHIKREKVSHSLYIHMYMFVNFQSIVVLFNDISIFMGYLMPKVSL